MITASAFRSMVWPDGEPRVPTNASELAIGGALDAAAHRIAHDPIPDRLREQVERAVRELGGELFAVRSSSAIEDREHGAAPGVFESHIGVTEPELWPAIRAVWASALAPFAIRYARVQHTNSLAIAVIVQRAVSGERAVIYTRSPSEPHGTECVIERAGSLASVARAAWPLAEQVERAIGARDGADVEMIGDWIVQARPIVHQAPVPARVAPPPAMIAPLLDGRLWQWDIAHNPDPLSPAQVGLVERVERAAVAPWSMRVCGGYLYISAGHDALAGAPPPAALPAIEARLAATLEGDTTLADALDRYVAFYTIWSRELVPLVAAAKQQAGERRGPRPSSVEACLLAAARGDLAVDALLERLSPLAPAWDVAVPTFGEQPELVHDAVRRARAVASVTTGDHQDEGASDLAERDDWWFARAQAMVRRAILATARSRGISSDDACWLVVGDLLEPIDPITATRRAAAHRAAYQRAARWEMPLRVPIVDHAIGEVRLRGVGGGPRVVGRVVRYASLASAVAVGHGDVVVTRSVTPALAVLVVGCAAIVSETGGLLDHGAAMARELGITYLVGCTGAWTDLVDGSVVVVDPPTVRLQT